MPSTLKIFLSQLSLTLIIIFVSNTEMKIANAHGTIISPESRIYKCRFHDNPENPINPACRAAKDLAGSSQFCYDWNAVRQANADGNHRSIIPDGQLCSGGNTDFSGLDIGHSKWNTTPIEADRHGQFEFIYHATAAHSTRDMIFLITKASWAPGTILKWSDMEEFCRFGSTPLVQDETGRNVYRMKCDLPKRSGAHVIYHIWQRDDSGEAFYSCSDVLFESELMTNCASNASCTLPAINLVLDN